MWGEIHKSTNMIALYHFDEASGTSHSDAMGNYDLTSGSSVDVETDITKSGNGIAIDPPSNNSYQGAIHTTVSDLQINYQDVENLRTIGVWCYPTYTDNVYSSYGQSIIASENLTYSSFQIYKQGVWNTEPDPIPSWLEDKFRFSYSLRIWKADSNNAAFGCTTNQDYYFSKPYFLLVVFKPSDVGTTNGYIDFYINFEKINRYEDPGTVDTAWRLLYSNSQDRYLYIGAPSNNPQSNNVFEGRIDEVFLSKDTLTHSQINSIKNNWKNAFII